jgi:hypothetical protein
MTYPNGINGHVEWRIPGVHVEAEDGDKGALDRMVAALVEPARDLAARAIEARDQHRTQIDGLKARVLELEAGIALRDTTIAALQRVAEDFATRVRP